MNFYLLLVFISWMSMMVYLTQTGGRNRELYFPSYYFFAGRRLRNHKIKTEHVKDLDQCEFLCYQHDDCVSVNIRKDPAIATGQRECELNNSTRIEHDRDVEDNNAYLYRGAKNSCGKSPPCYNSGTCQSGFTDKGYRCLCKPGVEGEHCKDSWKKINDAPVCFGSQGDAHGTFTIKESGLIYTFKLVYRSGSLTCNPGAPASFWGCDLSSYGNRRLHTVITYLDKTVLLPVDYFSHNTNCRKYSYQIPGIDVNSPELLLNDLPASLSVFVGQEFQIWYGQDLVNCSENNNSGKACADVYARYA